MLKVPRRNVAELCRIEYDNARVCMMCTAVPCVRARTGMDADAAHHAYASRGHGKYQVELPRLVLLELD